MTSYDRVTRSAGPVQKGESIVRVVVRVHPRSSRNALQADASGGAEVWTTAPPAEGRANEAVCRLVAEWLDVPVSAVRIVTGVKGRTKTIEIAGRTGLPT